LSDALSIFPWSLNGCAGLAFIAIAADDTTFRWARSAHPTVTAAVDSFPQALAFTISPIMDRFPARTARARAAANSEQE